MVSEKRAFRFDLTYIEGRRKNSTLNVRLTAVGETVLKVRVAVNLAVI